MTVEEVIEQRLGHIRNESRILEQIYDKGKEWYYTDIVTRRGAEKLIENIGEAINAIHTAYLKSIGENANEQNRGEYKMPPPFITLDIPWLEYRKFRDVTTSILSP